MATVIRGDDNWDTSIPSNVVSTTSQTYTQCASGFADITGATVTITPSSTSSKVLVTFSAGAMSGTTANEIQVRILRGSTIVRSITRYGFTNAGSGEWSSCPIAVNFLDSPSTTSATTYQLQMSTTSDNDFRVNHSQSNYDGTAGIVSTATEIGG
jgi:hypothetical protein